MAAMSCDHPNKGFYKKRWQGSTEYFHVIEYCPDCRKNVRGDGTWISGVELAQLKIQRERLPTVPDATAQKGLFDSLE
jgi:hypothetical protein